MHSQINRAIGSTISERTFSEIQNIVGTLSWEQRDYEFSSSNNNQDNSEAATEDLSPYMAKGATTKLPVKNTEHFRRD